MHQCSVYMLKNSNIDVNIADTIKCKTNHIHFYKNIYIFLKNLFWKDKFIMQKYEIVQLSITIMIVEELNSFKKWFAYSYQNVSWLILVTKIFMDLIKYMFIINRYLLLFIIVPKNNLIFDYLNQKL